MPAVNHGSNVLFESGAFESSTLTQAFINAPYTPGQIAARGLFEPRGIQTTKARIEWREDRLSLVPSSPRGGFSDINPRPTRKMVEFTCPHLRTRDTLQAAAIQDVRDLGTDALKNIETERNNILASMKTRLGFTVEFHRMRALAGQVLDADGSVLIDLLAEFGVTQQVHSLELDLTTTNVRNRIVAAKRLSEAVLGADTPKSWVCFASAQFIDSLVDHPSVEATLAGWLAAREMRDDVRADFEFGNVQFVEMRNPEGVTFVEEGAAYLVPEGIPGLLVTRYAPADYLDTVNAEGQEAYVRAEPLPFNRGVQLEGQSNPVSVVTRPRAVIKLTASD